MRACSANGLIGHVWLSRVLERTTGFPLTPALSPWEREQDELPLGCVGENKERPTGRECPFSLAWRGSATFFLSRREQDNLSLGSAKVVLSRRGSATVSLSHGERVGVRGGFVWDCE